MRKKETHFLFILILFKKYKLTGLVKMGELNLYLDEFDAFYLFHLHDCLFQKCKCAKKTLEYYRFKKLLN